MISTGINLFGLCQLILGSLSTYCRRGLFASIKSEYYLTKIKIKIVLQKSPLNFSLCKRSPFIFLKYFFLLIKRKTTVLHKSPVNFSLCKRRPFIFLKSFFVSVDGIFSTYLFKHRTVYPKINYFWFISAYQEGSKA